MNIESLNLYLDIFYRALGIPEALESWVLGGSVVCLLLALRYFRSAIPDTPAASVTLTVVDDQLEETSFDVQRSQETLAAVIPEAVVDRSVLEKRIPISAAPMTEVAAAIPEPVLVVTPRAGAYREGLEKTRRSFLGRLTGLLSRGPTIDPSFLDELEEQLVLSDLGIRTTQKLIAELKTEFQGSRGLDAEALRSALKDRIRNILGQDADEISPRRQGDMPRVVLVVGVNGVGKTTTIGKLAQRFSEQGAKVLIAACDTFRAAAVDQLSIWAERTGSLIVSGAENAKPSTVAYQAIERSRQGDVDVVIVDTAGRLHTRVNLMNELSGVLKIIEREQPGAPHETILVVDAATGQNALEQAREFHRAVRLSGIVVTKLDGTPKGGIVVAIKSELGIPIRYVGVGEQAADLRVFSADDFVDALFDEEPAEIRANRLVAA